MDLVASAEAYSFSDLLEIKKVRDLCAMSVRPAVIRQSLDAMRKQAAGVEKPLLEASALVHGEASRSVPSRRQAAGADRRPVPDGFFRARKSADQHAGAEV